MAEKTINGRRIDGKELASNIRFEDAPASLSHTRAPTIWTTTIAPKVLLIEDDPSFIRIMESIARKAQVHLTSCRSLKDIGSLTRSKFDAAIVDFDLGDTNGVEVIRYLERFWGDIPIILVSQSEPHTPIEEWPHSIKGFMRKTSSHKVIFDSTIATLNAMSR